MSASPRPPSKLYILAAVVIAVTIWMVLGAPDSDPAIARFAVARNSAPHR